MNTKHTVSRTKLDRLRHTILFEVGLITTLIPLGSLFFDGPKHHIGFVAVAISLLAMIWNLVFNYLFDQWLLKAQGHCEKSVLQRVLHTLLFEFGLILVTVPLLAVSLNLSFIEAFIADIGFVVYALFYAALYNVIYDRVFPVSSGHRMHATQE
ncbi:PACE efflux transporter [Vibrio ulleungensis]|uniref:PACE efflux transporter n=1 Tax=Vibrio ulleungensis TaxID=2807619 RepID=A0ABS2HEU0_9VIBR|nr:PACE efflux transporter [Vibrio ulleungensis]MBM7035606.1 PACE efflux transporter [Vibrio ulleungensis]